MAEHSRLKSSITQSTTTMTNTGLKAFAMILGIAAGTSAAAEAKLLTDVTHVDVETVTLTPERSVLIQDGVSVEIGATVEAAETTVFDVGGRFLIPGLWDSHISTFLPDEPDTAFPL